MDSNQPKLEVEEDDEVSRINAMFNTEKLTGLAAIAKRLATRK
jgi:hypothetical protein